MTNGTTYTPSNWGRLGRGLLIGAGTAAGLYGLDYIATNIPLLLKGGIGSALGGVLLIFVNTLRDKLRGS